MILAYKQESTINGYFVYSFNLPADSLGDPSDMVDASCQGSPQLSVLCPYEGSKQMFDLSTVSEALSDSNVSHIV